MNEGENHNGLSHAKPQTKARDAYKKRCDAVFSFKREAARNGYLIAISKGAVCSSQKFLQTVTGSR